ncbi:MAG: elongation factor G [candidate division WOR-3 bacterium]
MNKYLEGITITAGELKSSLKRGILTGSICPVLLGDAYTLIGVETLLNFIIDYLPSPLDLGDIIVGEKKIKRAPDAPLVSYIFKTVSEPHLGELLYVRVLSGKIAAGTTVLNANQEREEKINQIYLIKGKEREENKSLETGSIGGLVKLKLTRTGDTLTSPDQALALPKMAFPEPSISMAIVPKTKGDEERVSNGLSKLHEEDPTFSFHYDPELKQLLISGIGESHLEVILSRLKRKFTVEVELHKPRIPYRETFTKKSEAQGKYKKQTGGRGQYGDVWLRIEPLPRGTGFQFKDEIFGGAVPSKYFPSVEKGVVEAMAEGILAGYQVTDISVTLYDGSFHPVDSSDIAFKIAGSMAFKNCAEKGGMVLLEPISEVEVVVPEAFMGDVMGDLNSRRGKILGMDAEGRLQRIKALVPQAEMYKYSTSLRSMTQGRGFFTMKFHHYEEVPREIATKIIEEAKKAKTGS